jgi:hypothetical protein
MNTDIKYMRIAFEEAKKAYKKKEVPVGCVIVCNDKVIAKAHNLRNSKKNVLDHAEVRAINKACKKLKKWILRVSQHRFWGRAQYEILLAQWPFGSYKLTNDIKEFFAKNKEFDIDNYDQQLALYNIFTSEMDKIDIHYQVEMNIDVITDILYKEFKYRIWVNPIIDFFKKIFNKIKYGILYK